MPANEAIKLPPKLLQAAVAALCYTEDAKVFGKYLISKYAESTLSGYLRVFLRYKGFLQFVGLPMYPPSRKFWQFVVEFTPSTKDREIYTKAKAVWQIYCQLNNTQMPDLVAEAFKGRSREQIPDVQPQFKRDIITKKEVRQVIVKIFNVCRKSPCRMNWAVLFSILASYFGTLRACDIMRLMKISIVWTEEGAVICSNTRKNDKTGKKRHQGFVPFTPDSLNYGLIFKLCWSHLVRTAPSTSRYLFQNEDKTFISPAAVARQAKKIYKIIGHEYRSEKEFRAAMLTYFFTEYSLDKAELLGNWSAGGAASYYLRVNPSARFAAARSSLA